jgi:hypothetical protein
MKRIRKWIDKVVDFKNHFYRSLFIVFAWYGLHFLILLLIF